MLFWRLAPAGQSTPAAHPEAVQQAFRALGLGALGLVDKLHAQAQAQAQVPTLSESGPAPATPLLSLPL